MAFRIRFVHHIIFLALIISGRAIGQENTLSVAQFDTAYARSVMNRLSSAEFAGRGYVRNGDRNAAEYIHQELLTSGCEFLEGRSFQEFTFPVNTFPGAMRVMICKDELKPGTDYIVHPGSPPVTGGHTVHHTPVNEPGFVYFSEESLDQTLGKKEIDSLLHLFDEVTGIMIKKRSKLTWWVSTSVIDKPVIFLSSESEISNCYRVELDIGSEQITHKTQNVVGYLKGTDDQQQFVVITGHYDHLGMMGDETMFNGANDNASGIALMLALARYYAAPENRLPCPVMFIAFAGEEAGLIGSEYYVKNPLIPISDIRFLINLDLMGTGEEGITVVNGSVHKEEFELLTVLNDSAEYFTFIKARGKAANSDHYHFSEQGVPAFFIYTLGPRKSYHDVNDVAETVEFPKLDGSLQLISSFIKSICSTEQR